MGKYSRKKKKNGIRPVLTALLAVLLLALLICLMALMNRSKEPLPEQGSIPESTAQTEIPATAPSVAQITEPDAVELRDGLQILTISKFAGMFMEDGTNEIVSDVMMLILQNNSEQDLQLARISIAYPDVTAEFEVTNLPAGEKVVLLEKNRLALPAEEPLTMETRNVAFFREPMQLREEQLQITGSNGSMEVTNISGGDISGDIYIYYKNAAADLLYGGITYRACVKGGLKAGDSQRIIAGHFSKDSSRILQVEIIQ